MFKTYLPFGFVAFALVALSVRGAYSTNAVSWKGNPGADDAKQAQFVIDGYRANREGFDFLTCRFTITKGSATSLEDVLAGRLTNPDTVECVWVVEGAKEKYILDFDIAKFQHAFREAKEQAQKERSKPSTLSFSTPFGATKFIGDESLCLRYSPEGKGANLGVEGDNGLRDYVTPLNFGIMGPQEVLNPSYFLKEALLGNARCSMDNITNHLGATLDAFQFVGNAGWRHAFGFDPAQGFALVRASSSSGQRPNETSLTYVTELKQTPKGWFPMRAVSMIRSETSDGRFAFLVTADIKVLELNVTKKPTEGEFRIELPAGTSVIGSKEDMRAFVRLANDEKVGLDQLPDLKKRCLQALAMRQKEAGYSSRITLGTTTANPLYWWLGGGALLVICLIVFAIQRARAKGPTR
jgi:hypothetical protein